MSTKTDTIHLFDKIKKRLIKRDKPSKSFFYFTKQMNLSSMCSYLRTLIHHLTAVLG